MFLSFKLASFDERNIILSEKTKNNVLQKGDFYRINYSNHLMSINGIYLYFPLRNVKIEPYFNKLKCNFNKDENSTVIEQLKGILERRQYIVLKSNYLIILSKFMQIQVGIKCRQKMILKSY